VVVVWGEGRGVSLDAACGFMVAGRVDRKEARGLTPLPLTR